MPDITGATVLDDLPDFILIEEIFLRLPSEDVLRCRAVRRSWRSATSTHEFMLDHHARQPLLPIISHLRLISKGVATSRLLAFRQDAIDRTLRPLIRCATPDIHDLTLHATLDGLLLVSSTALISRRHERLFYVCNPATHKCASLHQLHSGVHIVGFYRHHPSREYRVLYFVINDLEDGDKSTYFVLTVGSADEPRYIWSEWPPAPSGSLEEALLDGLPCFSHNRAPPPVLQCGSLHWMVSPLEDQQPARVDAMGIQDIVAFDTALETFRWMRRPAQPGPWPLLFEVNGAMALCGTSDGTSHTDIHVLVMQDYEAGVWALIHRISFSPSRSLLADSRDSRFFCRMVVLGERELLVRFPLSRLLHCHVDGHLIRLAVLKCDDPEDRDCGMLITLHFLKESILPLPFFELQEEDGANNKEHPFIMGM